jgi:hypothetical protein
VSDEEVTHGPVPLKYPVINKLAVAAHILGMALWCAAATSGRVADAPASLAPMVSVSQTAPRRQDSIQ